MSFVLIIMMTLGKRLALTKNGSLTVINEWQNDHWIASSFDGLGNRSQITVA
ncbi:hypothetical protein [Lysinibacillus xylanilyticus]|uniref:Uncharacterized protein n=1 Tax=Lysinibacillus xylanilyticus TaxID=582475 RepID=A0ABT4EW07_9BACI|nr:hypothetical protein [Lysinibacillus xylanilyticus]MCY9549864.1 hypothetical protein [Lysinibacillus xylanilyticus]